jgi:hypothetical protein
VCAGPFLFCRAWAAARCVHLSSRGPCACLRLRRAGQHVLERTSVLVSEAGAIEARFTVGLPAQVTERKRA